MPNNIVQWQVHRKHYDTPTRRYEITLHPPKGQHQTNLTYWARTLKGAIRLAKREAHYATRRLTAQNTPTTLKAQSTPQ